MKKSKEKCAQAAQAPRPNLKNKSFVKWSRAELCKKDDNIVSSDWRETLKTTNPFVPAYNNAPLCMNYLLSGEYGRIWQKERDDWFKSVTVPKGKEKDMEERKKKIRMEARTAKKKAEKEAKERKERKAKEAEARAKAEAEKAEKIKAKEKKFAAKKKAEMPKPKKERKEEPVLKTTQLKEETCPKNWVPVELTVQCECSDHNKETKNPEKQQSFEIDANLRTQNSESNQNEEQSCIMCGDYMQQLKTSQTPKTETEKEHYNKSADPVEESRSLIQ